MRIWRPLEKNGYIRRDPTKPRAIEILDDSFGLTRREMVNVPIIGTVAAGQPILAQENIENYFPIPSEYMPNEQSFMLRVKGESMINAGILNGDCVLVRQQPTAGNGDIVVALIDDSATVKNFLSGRRSYPPSAGKRHHGSYHRGGRRPDPGKSIRGIPVFSIVKQHSKKQEKLNPLLFYYSFFNNRCLNAFILWP